MCNSNNFFVCVQFLFIYTHVVGSPNYAILYHSNCRKTNTGLTFSGIAPIV